MKDNRTSFIKKYHIIPWLLCLIFAFFIWLYVMEVDSPDYEASFEDCSITLLGISNLDENNLAVFSGADATIDVTVKGQKSTISKYTSSDITVTADVSKISESGNYTIDLYYDLPSGLTFSDSTFESINLYIDKRITSNVTLKTKLSSYQIGTGYELGEVKCELDTISITGAESIIKGVSYAIAEVNLSDATLTESLTKDAVVTLYDVNDNPVDSKYIRMSQSSVSLSIPVLTTKEVKLTVTSKYGYYNDKNTSVTVEPASVVVKGDATQLNAIDTISIATLDEKSISANTTVNVDITLPDGITLSADEPTSAKVDVKFNGMVKKSVRVTNITADAPSDLEYDILTNALTIDIFGESSAVANVTAKDITLVADLSGYTAGSDSTIIYPTVAVKINSTGVVYELNSYNVQISLK